MEHGIGRGRNANRPNLPDPLDSERVGSAGLTDEYHVEIMDVCAHGNQIMDALRQRINFASLKEQQATFFVDRPSGVGVQPHCDYRIE